MCEGCKFYKWDECTNDEAMLEDNFEEMVENEACPYYIEYFPEHPDKYWRED